MDQQQTPEGTAPGMVRLDKPTRALVDRYRAERGISYNAAMNILVRAGLRAEGYPTAGGGEE